jgi:hypothetical protein
VTPGRWFGGKTGEANLSATVLLAVGKGEPGAKEPETGPMDYPVSRVGQKRGWKHETRTFISVPSSVLRRRT